MRIYEIDPTRDERWDELLERHPQASVFHTRGWLEALRQTYGYVPVAFTTSSPGYCLENGIPFCEVSSWLSGRRLVSLPFSDHCTPLCESSEQLLFLLFCLNKNLTRQKWDYIEIRPKDPVVTGPTGFGESSTYIFHQLNLRAPMEKIIEGFHRDCVQRKIQRAVREALVYEEGTSDKLVGMFYNLLLMTRRRHGLPAQPIAWFRNLIACMGESVKIRVALKNGRPVASILTLRYKDVLVYKYGCSDENVNNLGGTQLLLWKAIHEGKECGLSEFDMGRSDCDEPGLITFKDRWGAARTPLAYLRFPESVNPSEGSQTSLSRYVLSHAPNAVLAAAGRVLYRHMG